MRRLRHSIILLKLLNHVNIKSWISNLIKRLKVSINVLVACMAENFLQDFLKHFKSMRVVRKTKFTKSEMKCHNQFIANRVDLPQLLATANNVV